MIDKKHMNVTVPGSRRKFHSTAPVRQSIGNRPNVSGK